MARSADVLASFSPAELTRAPVVGTGLTEVLALRGRAGRWLERDGRLAAATPEGAAELDPPQTREAAERLVQRFEPGTVLSRARALRMAPSLPEPATGELVVERYLARTTSSGGAQLVRLVLTFDAPGARRDETVLIEVAGAHTSGAPASERSTPSTALSHFWALVNEAR